MNISNKFIVNHAWAIGVIFVTTVISSCSSEPKLTAIHITNNSKSELDNVVVSGSGFSQKISNITIGKKQSIFVRPTGESSVTVNFNTAGKNYSSGQQGYFEPGYQSMSVTIAPDFTVKLDDTKL